MTVTDVDILVVGGGLPGLLLAAIAAGPAARGRWRVGVVDPVWPETPPAGGLPGVRVFALAPAVIELLRDVGAWQLLPAARVAAYRAMQVWQGGTAPTGPASLRFDADDAGQTTLGAIVEHDRLRHALWTIVAGLPAAHLITGALAPSAPLTDGSPRVVTLADGASVRARLVVAADGAGSRVRAALGLQRHAWSYAQTALVGHVRTERAHDDTAWQAFQADGPVALLPLPDGLASFVWSVPTDRAVALAALPDVLFGAELTAATDGVLGALTPVTPRASFPLAAHHTPQYTGARFALVGDAAHQVHPLAGQGVNLGLLDAAALGQALVRHGLETVHADPGEQRVLRRYERARKGDNLATLATIDALHRLFAGGSPALARFAGLGLGLVDRAGPARRFLVARATGRAS